jgi:hypothetical protein
MPTKKRKLTSAVPDEDITTPESLPADEVEEDETGNGDGDKASRSLKGGWGEGQREQEASVPWASSFRPEKTSQIIKFLDDEPYASFRRHWIESVSREGGRTNRPYTCLQSFKKPCPLCKAGDRPSAVSAFNIVLLDNKGEVILRSWDCGARLFQVLKGYANDPKIGPLSRHFFLVSKSGEKATTQYNVSSVRASALEEDFDIPVPTDADLAEAIRTKYDASIIQVPKVSQMEELADEIADEYDTDDN